MSGSRKRWLLAAAVVSIILVVSSAGLMGVAAVESPDGERTINDTALDPGETTEVEVHVTDVDQDWLAIYEDVDSDLEATITDFDPVPLVDRQLDDTDAVVVWEDDEPLGSTTLTYEVTVPEDAEEGDFYTFDGAVDLGGGTETDTTGENVITVGEPDDVLIDITTPEYVDEGKTYEAGVEVFNPTDEEVSGDLVYTVDGESKFVTAIPISSGEPYERTEEFTAPDELAGEAHAVEFGDFNESHGVFSGIPAADLGDVDESGEVKADNVLAVQTASFGFGPEEPFNEKLADVTRNGQIGADDVLVTQLLSFGFGNPQPTIAEIEASSSVSLGAEAQIEATIENEGRPGVFDGAELRLAPDNAEDGVVVGAEPVEIKGQRISDSDQADIQFTVDTSELSSGTYEYGVFIGDDYQTGEIEVTN